MIIKFIILSLVFINLFADIDLKKEYLVPTNEVNLSTIVPNTDKDINLFEIQKDRFITRVKSSELIAIAHKYTDQILLSKYRYIQFMRKSPINITFIKDELSQFYANNYKTIKIRDISIQPRGYIDTLPKSYTFHISPRNALRSQGILSIKSKSHKQTFFDYTINASMDIYVTKYSLKKGAELSHINTVKKTIDFTRFRAMPLQDFKDKSYQLKYHLKENQILTHRNTQTLKLVKRGSTINVVLSNKNMDISFSAEALEDGVYGDIIKVRENNSKIIKVRIVAKNRGILI